MGRERTELVAVGVPDTPGFGHGFRKPLLLRVAPSTEASENDRYRTPDTGHRTPDTGHRTPDTGHRTPDTGHRTPVTGHPSLIARLAALS
jgi:hypothetical protein